MTFTELFPTLFRYIVLAILYMVVFANFTKVSIQFLLFMVIMILNFFTMLFVGRDMIVSSGLMKAVYGTFTEQDSQIYKNPYTIYFVGAILLTALLFVCSISIVLAVFDYGKKSATDYRSYKLTPLNTLLMNQFQLYYQQYIIYLAGLVYFIIFAHTEGETKLLMFNLAAIVGCLVIVVSSIYCCYLSVLFLNNKKYKKQLYQ